MVKLQCRTRKRKRNGNGNGKEYQEFSVTLSPRIIEHIGWKKGDEIMVTPNQNQKHIILRKMEMR